MNITETEIFMPTFPDGLRDGDYIRVEPSGYAGWFQMLSSNVITLYCCSGPCVEHEHTRKIVLQPNTRVLKRYVHAATEAELADRQAVIDAVTNKRK